MQVQLMGLQSANSKSTGKAWSETGRMQAIGKQYGEGKTNRLMRQNIIKTRRVHTENNGLAKDRYGMLCLMLHRKHGIYTQTNQGETGNRCDR